MITLKISEYLAREIETWAQDERRSWPEGTIYQSDLAHLLNQLRGKVKDGGNSYGAFDCTQPVK